LAPPAQPGPRISAQADAAPAPDKPLPAPQASPSVLKPAKAVTANEAEIPLPKKTRFFRELKAKEDFNPVMSASRKTSAPPPPPAQGASASASGLGLEAVAANLPNFPFPWYLARVRSNLFTQWAQKNQNLPLECLISFVIGRDGSISRVKVKRSSGNRYFDYDAVSSVEQSAPFPPLPEALPDPDLRVHVNFKALSRSSS
ncbi:MAG: TonB family protein, partial [Elusimicrobia bacterium]|nr:TonB family protein [Elusimicrobiota bacterium]